jgi:hypothetical protein
MPVQSSWQCTWSDAQLVNAVTKSTNWRGVMRELGLGERATSAGAIRIVRRHASRLGLDTSHFRGKRRWSDAQLKHAISEGRSWNDVLTELGLSANSGNAQGHIRGHAVRLGLDLSHLRAGHAAGQPAKISLLKPDLKYLRVAGPTMAATWFAVRGCAVSFPAEPALYDLLVDMPEGIRRVQVKTSTSLTKDGWMVTVGRHPNADAKRGHLAAYDPESIDLFFVVDGDFAMYLIPSRALAGRVRVLIRAYTKYVVGNAGGLLGAGADQVFGVTRPVS